MAVVNKADLPPAFPLAELSRFGRPVAISARSGSGLDELQAAMVDRLGGNGGADVGEDVVITERRHREALLRALAAMEHAKGAVETGAPLECLALEIREGLSALGQITGETTPDEILDQIFSRFCIGK
jgi:tRNA modification GTPase